MTQRQFIEGFLSTFAKNLTETEKKRFNVGSRKKDYLWNLFAARLVPCFENNEARQMYNIADKTNAVEIVYSGNKDSKDDEYTTSLKDNHLTAEGIDEDGIPEFYVIGNEFSWCYVVTHEFDLCGPFFCYKSKINDTGKI